MQRGSHARGNWAAYQLETRSGNDRRARRSFQMHSLNNQRRRLNQKMPSPQRPRSTD